MAVQEPSIYVDPDVYISERPSPSVPQIATGGVLGLIGIGARTKGVSNEEVVRGGVSGGAITLAGSAPHIATIDAGATRLLRSFERTTLYRDGIEQPDSAFKFRTPTLTGSVTTTVNIGTSGGAGKSFGLEIDGRTPITIVLKHHNTTPVAPVVNGALVTIVRTFSGSGATAAMTEIRDAINLCLAAMTAGAMGTTADKAYGAAYANVASVSSGALRISSAQPANEHWSYADVRVFASGPTANDGVVPIFGSAVDAVHQVEVAASYYSATSTYTLDYVNTASTVDVLATANVQAISRVGSTSSADDYERGRDWVPTAGVGNDSVGSDGVSWTGPAAVSFVGNGATTASPNYDLTGNPTFQVALDDRSLISVALTTATGLGDLGYAAPVSISAMTPAEALANFKAVLAANVNYGARYWTAVSTVVDSGGITQLALTSPSLGGAGSIRIETDAAGSAASTTLVADLFGSGAVGTSVGVGARPAPGASYFATYTVTRASSEYAVERRFTKLTDIKDDIVAQAPLGIASEIAFRSGVLEVIIVQANDATTTGSLTDSEFRAALAATERRDTITELAFPGVTSASRWPVIKDHIERMNSPYVQRRRCAWVGLANNVAPGDRDTVGTYCYTAVRSFYFAPESQGRGRVTVVAPPQQAGVTIDIARTDGIPGDIRYTLDGSYLAAMWAARQAAFTTPAESLAFKYLSAVNVDDITNPWGDEDRRRMSANGVFVTVLDNSQLTVFDPRTVEGGNAADPRYMYRSVSAQKDNMSRRIRAALKSQLLGVVPVDPEDFLTQIRIIVGGVITSEIAAGRAGPYRTAGANPVVRPIDYTRDIDVAINPNNPTRYFFNYGFNTRYPNLGMFGEFTVDNPYFVAAAT